MAKKTDPLAALLAASFKTPETPAAEVVTDPVVDGAVELFSESVLPNTGAVSSSAIDEDDSDKEEPELAAPVKATETEVSKPKAKVKAKAAPKVEEELPPLEFEGVRKTTVSFYAAEQAQVDRILDTLIRARRHRGGFSDAIKIALRLCPMNAEAIGKAWDEARAADRRTQRK